MPMIPRKVLNESVLILNRLGLADKVFPVKSESCIVLFVLFLHFLCSLSMLPSLAARVSQMSLTHSNWLK